MSSVGAADKSRELSTVAVPVASRAVLSIVAGCTAGILLGLPHNFFQAPPVVGVAPLAAFVILLLLPVDGMSRCVAALAAGCAFMGGQSPAFAASSLAIAAIAPATIASQLALVLGLGGWLGRLWGMDRVAVGTLSAALWLLAGSALEELGLPFVPLSSGLLALGPAPSLASRTLGVPALDAILILSSAGPRVSCRFLPLQPLYTYDKII